MEVTLSNKTGCMVLLPRFKKDNRDKRIAGCVQEKVVSAIQAPAAEDGVLWWSRRRLPGNILAPAPLTSSARAFDD